MLVLLALAVAQVLIGVLVFLQSQHNKKTEQRIFAVLAVLLTAWTGTNALLVSVDSSGSAQHLAYYDVINRIAFFLVGLLLMGIYWFSLEYPTRSTIGYLQKGVLGISALMAGLGPTNVVAGGFVRHGDTLSYHYGSLAVVLVLLSLVVVVSMYIRQSRVLRHAHDKQLKQQSVTLLLGMTLTVAHAVVLIILFPAMFGQQQAFFVIGYMAPFYLVATTGYGMLRQGLFNIRGIVVRSFAYVLVLGILSVSYAITAVLLTTFASGLTIPVPTLVLLVAMTLIVATLFQPLRNYFNHLTNTFFFRDYYDAQDVLDKVGSVLVGSIDAEKIQERVGDILVESLHTSHVSFVLRTQGPHQLLELARATKQPVVIVEELPLERHPALKAYVQEQNIELLAHVRTPHEDLGYLVLGARKSGVPYSSSDKRMVSMIADELAIGLQNALHFQEIQKFNRTLQQRVQEATRKLRDTNHRLRALDETKDEFITMASHQLRTPLTSVKGYLSMVLEGDAGKLNANQQKLLEQSYLSSQRMVYLISDLLNLSRLNTGKFVIEPIPVDLSEVVQVEVDQLMETAKARSLQLVYHRPASFPELMLDETKIHQVVMNFIDNAIYYTPSGGTVTVGLRETPTSVEYTVHDTGIGVPKAVQHKLFTKFYRAANAQQARPDGTGLGLFMAKKVVAAQGGAIIFESEEGKGSTFGFRFSKADHMVPAGTPAGEPAAAKKTPVQA